jgi:putative nucleotide binding protein
VFFEPQPGQEGAPSQQSKRYEEFAFVLDFIPRGKSAIIKEREGPIVQAIGEDRLTLLEILAASSAEFKPGERIPIGKENRTKIISVLGKLAYSELTNEAKNELEPVLEKMIDQNQGKYIAYFNELQPVTPRLHALELIPGIGKTFMKQIVNQREKKKFESFEELERRVGLREPIKLVAKRIVEELSGGSRILIFVHR